MCWIDFLICLFLGPFGVHKFREKRIGMGLLYLFTGGLFFIGWIVDCVRYFSAAINTKTYYADNQPAASFTATNMQTIPNSSYNPPAKTNLRFNWKWILTAVLTLIMLAFIPSIASLFALIGIALIIPIPQWQAITEKYITGKLKSILAGVLAALTIFTAPTTDTTAPEITPEGSEVSIAAPTHIHEYQEATCDSPKTCTICGESEGTPLEHNWLEATCETPKTCSICGAHNGAALMHSWTTPTCQQIKTCTICGVTEGQFAEHIWVEATCLSAKYCSVCGETVGELGDHSWNEATCLNPKTCSICNSAEGELGDHLWQDATCAKPMICSVCEITQGSTLPHTWVDATCTTLKTCSVCHATEGDYGPHAWEGPTCKTPKTCIVCNAKEGTSVDHSYSNHFCIYCEKEEAMVWITTTGSRYHSKSSCGNSQTSIQVYISDAIARGLTPCGRCY